MLVTVQRNEPGGKKEEQKKLLEHKGKKKTNKKKPNYEEGVKCWECGRAGLRPGWGGGVWGSGNGPKQHGVTSLHFIYFFCFVFFKSLTPPHHQALFFSDWDMQGHQKAANRSLNHCEQPWQTCREGMFVTPESRLQEEKTRQSTQITDIWEKKRNDIDTSVLCFMLGFCVNKWLQTSSSVYMQVTLARWFNYLWQNEAWRLQMS